jgi:hypothetical protein
MSQSTIYFEESDPPLNTADRSGPNCDTKVDSDELSRLRVFGLDEFTKKLFPISNT